MTVPIVSGAVPTTQVLRPSYRDGQYLSAADFDASLAYHRRALGRHELGGHLWGLVTGLWLEEVPDPSDATLVDVFLTPGLAVDGHGRQIVSFRRQPLDAVLFDAFVDQAHRSVWIEFEQVLTSPSGPGYTECGEGGPTRVAESFRLVVDPVVTAADVLVDGVVAVPEPLAGATIHADTSVPHQELPIEPPLARWLVRLGSVRWDGGVRRCRPAGDRLHEGRRYTGVVAADVLAPAGTLRLAPRTSPSDPDAAEFARVEGRLRVSGRINAEQQLWMEGDPIRFTLDAGAGDTDVPMTLVRDAGIAPVTHRLRLGVGKAPDATSAFSIGTEADAGTADPVVEVRMDGRVRVPRGPVDLGELAHREKLELHGAGYGIGTQPDTVYLRSPGRFAWFTGGKHSDIALAPGTGGALRLTLDERGALQFGTTVQQMLNLWSTSYGIGVQDGTLYARSGADFCWFRGGTHADTRSSPGGGTLAMKLDETGRLSVFGSASTTGDLVVGSGANARVRTRHVDGKAMGVDTADHLYLQWDTARNVVVGGAAESWLDVHGGLTVRRAGVESVHTIVKVITRNLTVANGFDGTRGRPGAWTASFAGELDEVYTVFATVTGFSSVGTSMEDNPARTDVPVLSAWVKVEGFSSAGAFGHAFCAQADAALENNNSTAITVVAVGRRLA